MIRLLLLAVVIGVVAAAVASLFMAFIDHAQEWLFADLPVAFGWSSTPWWWCAILLLISPVLIVLARRMPGATGKGPLTGFHFDNPLAFVPSILLAAFATLAFGMVLGPEAPLIVIGTAIGALATRRAQSDQMKAAMLLGGIAAIGAVFGNPFVTGFMILEFAAFGVIPAILLIPAFLALAAGYVTQIGIYDLPGLGVHPLAVPGLPAYDAIEFGNLFLGIAVAVLAGAVAVAVRMGAVRVDAMAGKRPTPVLFGAAIVTIIVLFIAMVGFDLDPKLVLFSGSPGMAELVQQTAIGTVLVILVAKAIAYLVALGGGYRGGPIFPATFLGVAIAVIAGLMFPSVPVTPLVAAGIAASAAGMIKLPGTSALLGAVLVAGTGAAVAPFAILGAVIGVLVRLAVDARTGAEAAKATATPAQAPA